ncbi:MAG: glycoside hydrolase [Bacteroidales bacterium]|nr:glycoside hydrolase [Bacteroidales bacterium]
MNKPKYLLPFFVLSLLTLNLPAQTSNLPEGITVRKIWSNDKYNAFTSLVTFKGTFYCAFREGENHVFGKDGETRIISSKDGINWESVALLKKEGYDLRDPKLSVTPEGRIMVTIGGSVYNDKVLKSRLTHVSFSDRSGKNFSSPQPIIISADAKTNMDWLWRVSWYKKVGYGVVYQLPEGSKKEPDEKWVIRLLKTTDGIHYDLVTTLDVNGLPNETTVRVMSDGEMLMMVRREGENKEGLWGRSKPPYKEWTWSSLGMRLGGPDFIAVENNLLVYGSRVHDKKDAYTALFAGDRSGNFRKILSLPSGGDNSYPAFVNRENKLYVSYYSSHEGKASIYLAEVPLSYIKETMQAPPMTGSVKIWDKAPHCAFTDIVVFKEKLYCTFRESTGHVPGIDGQDGKIRVIESQNGKDWKSAALIEEKNIDLRDPKLSVMPDGRLMITCGGSDYEGNALMEWHTRVMYSQNGTDWTPPRRVRGIPSNNWFFRLTWSGDTGYVASNVCGANPADGTAIGKERKLIVFKTTDGMNYEQVSENMAPFPQACEATIKFKEDKSMVMVIRNNARGNDFSSGVFAFSNPPYKEFRTIKIGHSMNGQNIISLGNGKWLVGTRESDFERPEGRKGTATVLMVIDEDGIYKRIFELPSGGDTSYPGFAVYQEKLWVSYYSSHEGNTAIYLSIIPMNELK